MLGVAAIPALIQFVGFIFMPESPRWLIQKGQHAEAKSVLQRLRGPDADIQEEYTQMLCNEKDNNNDGYFVILSRVLRDRYLRRALAIGCVLLSVQQLTGINTVMYYSATIIQMSGVYDKTTAVWLSSITASINFVCTFIGLYFVEKAGRRPVTLWSLAGVIASLVLLAIGFQIGANSAPDIAFNSTEYVDSSCAAFTGCNQCVSSSDCGFCFEDAVSGIVTL